MSLNDTLFARPPVHATGEDLVLLRALTPMARTATPGAALFLEEVRRLALVQDGPHRFVRLGAPVRYRDLRTKRERQVRVVRPEAADADENAVSVLSPVGAALIGLSEGAIFRWMEPSGRPRAIKVLELGG